MSDFIPGIYSYCNQWCERCAFTSRCAVFAGSQALADTDPASPGFWDEMLTQFAASHAHIPDVAEWKIELRQPTEEELAEALEQEQLKKARVEEEDLMKWASQYDAGIMTLLEDSSFWHGLARTAAHQAALGIRSPKEAMREAEYVTEYLHVIRRNAAISLDAIERALTSMHEPGSQGIAGYPDGLAKLALIALAESRKALTSLYGIFPDEDRILPMFARLALVEKEILKTFPEANDFIRPGFDEPIEAQFQNQIALEKKAS
jgi:hypothetical protein